MSKYIELDKALEKAQLACIIALCDENPDDYEDVDFSDEFAVSVNDLCELPAADVVERKRGEWVLEAHKENSNYGWNVTAECSECRAEKKVVWRGLFPNFCDALAKEVALDNAKSVKLSNFCPNCGADMRSHHDSLCDKEEGEHD